MTTYVSDIFQRAARIMGERTGTVTSVTNNGDGTSTLVLKGLVNTTGDDTFYGGDRLIVISAATHLCTESFIKTWVDSTGSATVLNAGLTAATNDTYMVVHREDYVLNEYQYAMAKTLEQTPRTYRQVIPATPLLTLYPFNAFTLTGDGDVDAVFLTTSPLMLHNEDFSLWQNGASAAPDGYTLEGTNATIARVSGGMRSNYAAQITAPVGNVVRLTQKIPESLSQWLTRRTFPVYIQMRAAMWAVCSGASIARCFIRYVESSSGSPVTTYAYSDYMSGTGIPEFPELSLTPSATQDQYEWGVEIAANHSATVSFAGLMQSTIDFNNSFQIKDSGSQAIPYKEFSTTHVVRNIGGLPYIELGSYLASWGQVVVYVRRPFPAYSTDADAFDDQYARVLTAGLINFLTEARKPDQLRDRLDTIRGQQQLIWARMSQNQVDTPIPAPPVRVDLWGA